MPGSGTTIDFESDLAGQGFHLGNLPNIWARNLQLPRAGANVSILGKILRAPASAAGVSSSLGGDLIQFGAQLFGNYANAKSQNKAAKRQLKLLQAAGGRGSLGQIYDYGGLVVPGYQAPPLQAPPLYQEPTMSILDASVNAAMFPAASSSAAPYVEPPYSTAAYYPDVMNASVPAVIGAAGVVATRIAATPMVRAAIAWLVRNGLPAAAAATAVAGLVQGGILGGADGPYANPKHNKCTGIMRGDVMAVKRVKRQGKRLMKVLRMAGVGGRRSAGRFRRRRAC
jgi:hypothetical protein